MRRPRSNPAVEKQYVICRTVHYIMDRYTLTTFNGTRVMGMYGPCCWDAMFHYGTCMKNINNASRIY